MKTIISKTKGFLFIFLLSSMFFVSCNKESDFDFDLTGDVILTHDILGPWLSNPNLYLIEDLTTPLNEILLFNSEGECKVEGLNFGNYCFECILQYETESITKKIIFQIKAGETTYIHIKD